ncbi:hypothetical protein PENARI_c011G06150 [Penicillium arizonense]|uniref:Uncharacterized protein n=1 Tax=Penicillium arizonense TaxID=1835702 RepID=A0A1F5LGD0_PENAI|nr:hypothetical protein PENARI_c011G06150 [Penicillium arizonense]OGE52001.1 hypothetical protein PENARI_c011G06150 [Penicillium arizonense]
MKFSAVFLAVFALGITTHAAIDDNGTDDARSCLRKRAPEQFECVGGNYISVWKNGAWTCCELEY